MEKTITGGATAGEKLEKVTNIVANGKENILFLINIFRPKSGNMVQELGEIKFSDGRLY